MNSFWNYFGGNDYNATAFGYVYGDAISITCGYDSRKDKSNMTVPRSIAQTFEARAELYDRRWNVIDGQYNPAPTDIK